MLSHWEDRPNDARIVMIQQHITHERLVNLNVIDWQFSDTPTMNNLCQNRQRRTSHQAPAGLHGADGTLTLSIRLPSVTSRHNFDSGAPASAAIATTVSTRLGKRNWRALRLTEMDGLHHRTAQQPHGSRQAVDRTHSPSSRIIPVSSAIGINSAGGIMPRSG